MSAHSSQQLAEYSSYHVRFPAEQPVSLPRIVVRTVGVILVPLCYVVGALWLLIMLLIALRAGPGQPQDMAGAAVGVRLSYRLFRTGKRLWPRSVRFERSLPTVLFLRAFADDARRIERPVRYDDATDLTSVEELVARIVAKRANLVAIAKPGALFLPPGPGFVHCGDQWKEEVTRWMSAASRIVLLISTTAGVFWELSQVLRPEYLSKTILLFPALSSYWGAVDETGMTARWKAFAAAAQKAGHAVEEPVIGGSKFLIAITHADGRMISHYIEIPEENKRRPLPTRRDYEVWLKNALDADFNKANIHGSASVV